VSKVCVVTGSGGLIGSEAVEHFVSLGYEVIGIDNNMRRYFFGVSVEPRITSLIDRLNGNYKHVYVDIRNRDMIDGLFRLYGKDIEVVIHAAAQPSHDWAAREPLTDFAVNAAGTLNLLESTRQHSKNAAFIFCSTNKVYGDRPNNIPMEELDTRYEPAAWRWWPGIDESMSIDGCLHSVFGASKVAADVMVQEYGRYFGMNTGVFRGGCLTGKNHASAELHGFLAYLVQCVKTGKPYTVYGYKGKQVRDNIHASDLVRAFEEFTKAPKQGEVYNIGGGRRNSCSVLEAIEMAESAVGKRLNWTYNEQARIGDHQWWITDYSKFVRDYPQWRITVDLVDIIREMAGNGKTSSEYSHSTPAPERERQSA
jgi:CDP-paratose 2-epimerase